MPSPYILVVGSFCQDLTFRCEQFPGPGETSVAVFITGPGGKGSNQAIAVGRTGAPLRYVGAIGCDPFGNAVQEFYRAEGIEANWVICDGTPSGCAGIFVNREGQNSILVALGANEKLQPSDVDPDLIAHAGILVLQLETHLDTVASLLQSARRAGVPTLLNPAPMRSDFPPELLRHVDILVPNETEFAALVRLLPELKLPRFSDGDLAQMNGAALQKLARGLGVPTVVITLGARGCFVSTEKGFVEIPAAPGIVAVDTTGAGDAFVGGFSAGYLESGGDLVRAARFGTCVAGLSVTKPGTAPSMPRRPEIDRLLATLPKS